MAIRHAIVAFGFFLSMAACWVVGKGAYLTHAIEVASESTREFSRQRHRAFAQSQEYRQLVKHWNAIEGLGQPLVSFAAPSLNAASWSSGVGQKALLNLSLVTATQLGDHTTQKIQLLCEALRHFYKATLESPSNPEHQISLADLQVQLMRPNQICSSVDSGWEPLNISLTAVERLAHAVQLAPFEVYDLFRAAMVYVGMGRKNDALALLRKNDEINPLFSVEQRNYAMELITEQEHLNQAIPRSYPSVIHWVAHFARNRPRDYLLWNQVFESALVDSLEGLRGRLRNGSLSEADFSRYLKAIASLPIGHFSDGLRQELDRGLSETYLKSGNTEWSRLLLQRSQLKRIPVLKSVLSDDLRPEVAMLHNWQLDDSRVNETIDALGSSLGFFVPQEYYPELIILESRTRPLSERLSRNLQIFASDDNQRFYDVTAKSRIEVANFDSKQAVAISLPSLSPKFLKIHYSGSRRVPEFQNDFSKLLQVYGEKRS